MREYRTRVVAAVHQTKAGSIIAGMPTFATVKEAVSCTDATGSLIFVPEPGAAEAAIKATRSGVGIVIWITEHIPQHDMMRVKAVLRETGVVGIRGDPFAGQLHTDVVKRFAEDPHMEGIILIGEIGGASEEDAGISEGEEFKTK
jgi:succinyl-CoA synthetase alpha subunit